MVSKRSLDVFIQWLESQDIADESSRWLFLRKLAQETAAKLGNEPMHRCFSKQDLLSALCDEGTVQRFARRDVDQWLSERQDRYHSYLREVDESQALVLKDNGEKGGRGRQKLFWLETVDLPDVTGDLVGDATRNPHIVNWRPVPRSEISLTLTGRFVFGRERSFKEGGLRSKLFWSRAIFSVALPALIAIPFCAAMLHLGGPIQAWHLVGLILIAGALLISREALGDLRYRQRSGAFIDTEYVSFSDPRTIVECRKQKSGTIYQLARYEADCPICQSQLSLSDGDPEWPLRIVGRCEASPAEHVYSLDRISLKGQALRPAYQGS